MLKRWKAPGDAKGSRGEWTFVGRLASGKDVEFRVSDKDAAMKAPASEQQWTLGPKFADAFPKSGDSEAAPQPAGAGLLPSLFLYRLMAVDGPKGFDDASYLGAFPLPGSDGLLDVVLATYRGIDSWFYFDAHGQLAAMEVYPEEHADPLEFHFANYRAADGRDLPGRLKIVSGDSVFETFDLDKFRFGAAGK